MAPRPSGRTRLNGGVICPVLRNCNGRAKSYDVVDVRPGAPFAPSAGHNRSARVQKLAHSWVQKAAERHPGKPALQLGLYGALLSAFALGPIAAIAQFPCGQVSESINSLACRNRISYRHLRGGTL